MNEHWIDLLAAIVDCNVAMKMNLAGFAINLHHRDMRSKRKSKILRLKERSCRKSWLHVWRKIFGQVRLQRDFLDRHLLARR